MSKHVWLPLFLLLILGATVFSGCARREAARDPVFIDGTELVFDEAACTMTYGKDVYHYQFTADGLEIAYPNGLICFWNRDTGGAYLTGGWRAPLDYDGPFSGTEMGYLDEVQLRWSLEDYYAGSARRGGDTFLPGLLLLCLGGFSAASPRTSWYLSYGWRYKNAEPSDLALAVNRIGGIVFCALGLLFLLL